MAEKVEYPISVRLPGYVVRKIDELVEKREFRSRSDFIKFAVTFTLGQMMLEEAKELAKNLSEEEIKAESEKARKKLERGEFEDEEREVKETLRDVEREYRKLMGAEG